MSKNINQIFVASPITTNLSTDLMYFGRSPYGLTDDRAMLYSNFAAQFLQNTNMSAETLLGNPTGSPAPASEITIGAGLDLIGTSLSLAHIAHLHILGNDSGITGAPGSIAVGAGLTMSGGTISATSTASGVVSAGLINQLAWYAANGTTVSGLAAAASSVLVTSAGSVPSLSTTLPSGLTIPGYATSGANSNITSLTGLTGKIQAPTAIASSTGANVLGFTYVASAVNYISITNNIATARPGILATGTDTNIGLNLYAKGFDNVAIFSHGDTTPQVIAAFSPTLNAINYLTFMGSAAGNAVKIATQGTDTNISINVASKGSGSINFFGNGEVTQLLKLTTTSTAGVNYLDIFNAATNGNPTVFARGTDTDIGIDIVAKGTDRIGLFSNGGTYFLATFNYTGTAVNYLDFQASATTVAPSLNATGTDTNIAISLISKGNKGINIKGYADGTSAAAGYVREYLSSIVTSGSPVALVNVTGKTLTSISLTAGEWIVYGELSVTGGATTTVTSITGGLSATTNSISTPPNDAESYAKALTTAGTVWTLGTVGAPYIALPPCRVNVSTTTTYYLVAFVAFAVSTCAGFGKIWATRI